MTFRFRKASQHEDAVNTHVSRQLLGSSHGEMVLRYAPTHPSGVHLGAAAAK